MPIISVGVASYAPSLRKVISTLKAALVVSAAAILSQAQGDLEANAAAAFDHLDDVAARLHAVRDDVLRQGAGSLAEAGETSIELDTNLLTLLDTVVDDRSDLLKQALRDVVGSPERDGLDAYVAAVGELGTAVNDLVALLMPQPSDEAPPFRYDQFFLEAMQDLSQRDWSAT